MPSGRATMAARGGTSQQRRSLKSRGLNLVEVLFAMAVLAVYALGMMQTCMKSQEIHRRNQEIESGYRYGQDRMEYYVRRSSSPNSWQDGSLISYPAGTYRFCGQYDYRNPADVYTPVATPPNPIPDRRYCQRLDVEELATNLRRLTVTTYLADPRQFTTPTPDTTKPNGGRILVINTLVRRP